MAISKKGARKIVVNGTTYSWVIRPRPTYTQGLGENKLSVAIEAVTDGQCVLWVTFPNYRPDNWLSLPAQTVTPKQIRNCIAQGLAKGWQPTKPGKRFQLIYELPQEQKENITS
jgi:hypothetical protein